MAYELTDLNEVITYLRRHIQKTGAITGGIVPPYIAFLSDLIGHTAKQQARIAELESALKPFADQHKQLPELEQESIWIVDLFSSAPDTLTYYLDVTVNDFHTAFKALYGNEEQSK